jgi:hypothetical protein
MLRKLLTLLAIVTGLTATGAPAQARVEAMSGVLLTAESGQLGGSEAAIRRKGGDAAVPATGNRKKRSDCAVLAARPCTPPAAFHAVLIGIDRAHE